MDEGLAISYRLLGAGVPVYASGGESVGTVSAVLAASSQDIFHGLLIATSDGVRFAPAEVIEALHEAGVDLRIDAAAAAALGPPEHGAPVYREDPNQSRWAHWKHLFVGRNDWDRIE